MSTDKDETTTTTDANQDATAQEQDTTQAQDAQTGGDDNSQGLAFTQKQQDHIDRLVGKRVARANETATAKMLEQLKASSIDDAATIMEAHRKAQEAEMSDLEKLQARFDTEQADKETLRQKHVALLTTNAILLEAAKKEHGLSPDVHPALLQLVDISKMNVGDDGVVTGAKEAVEQAMKDYPVLKTNGSRGSGVGSPVSGTPTPSLTGEKQDGKRRKRTSSI